MTTTRDTAMEPRSHAPPLPEDDPAWHALADGRLPAAQAAALRQQLEGNEAARDAIAHWQQGRDQLQALHQDLLHAAVPDALLAAALRAAGHQERQAQWWRWGGLAASVLLAFALGWAGRGQWAGGPAPGHQPLAGDAAALLATAPVQRFAQQAAVAHAVYQPEVRHPVEVTASQQEHLVQWLSKRLGKPLKVPVLAPQGYELVGGRLLPGDTGARAQFMYQNAAGQRITLYLGALAPTATTALSRHGAPPPHGNPPATTATAAAAFQFTQEGPVPGFYWTEGSFGYALSGQLSRAELLALATAVYRQLQL